VLINPLLGEQMSAFSNNHHKSPLKLLKLTLCILLFSGCNADIDRNGKSSKSDTSNSGSSATLTATTGLGSSVGGSNYVIYSAGEYLTNQTEEVWYKPGVLAPVIGTYHLNPTLVKQQLTDMYAHGQRKISLFLWYSEAFPSGKGTNGVYGHMVSAQTGALLDQHKSNLINLIKLIEEIGYTGMQFRFATQSACKDAYPTCWKFVESTIRLVVATKQKIDVIFDLDNEAGGEDAPNKVFYTAGFWRDFHATGLNNIAKTYGFSMGAAPGKLTKMVSRLNGVGVRPSVYAFTIYDDIDLRLKEISQELKALGESGKPIIVQETYYNSESVANDFKTGATKYGLNIQYIMQWPLIKGQKHFSVNYTPEYSNYHPFRPGISSAGLGCNDNTCIWAKGANFEANSYVDVRTATGSDIIATDKVPNLGLTLDGGKNELTLKLASGREIEALRSSGLRIAVVNPNSSTFSNLFTVKSSQTSNPPGTNLPTPTPAPTTGTAPVIDSAGSGCDDKLCIWITGRNIPLNAYVDIRSKSGSQIIGTYRGSDVAITKLEIGKSITLKLKTQQEKDLFRSEGLRVWIVNPNTGEFSGERLVRQ
jgi:hypothetical protein